MASLASNPIIIDDKISPTCQKEIISKQITAPSCPQGKLADMTSIELQRHERFLLPSKKDYNHQYYNIYNARLETYAPQFALQVRTLLDQEAATNDKSPESSSQTTSRRRSDKSTFDPVQIPICEKIPDAKPMQECVIIGITYKDMDKKPTILTDQSYKHHKPDDSVWRVLLRDEVQGFANDNENIAVYNDKNYCQGDDIVHLEDLNGRVPLVFSAHSRVYNGVKLSTSPTQKINDNMMMSDAAPDAATPQMLRYLFEPISPNSLVSGLLVAVQGELCENTGEFQVNRVIFPSLYFKPQHSPVYPAPSAGDSYVALISGLNLSHHTSANTIDNSYPYEYIELLTDFLTGSISSTAHEATSLFSHISTCIIAGDLIGAAPPQLQSDMTKTKAKSSTKSKSVTPTAQQTALSHADQFLTRLASYLDVYVMPGIHDPANFTFPQQPFHPCLFPSASTYSTFHGITNPCEIKLPITNSILTGTDGTNVVNITKFSDHNILSALSLTTLAQHLVPTAPDTIDSYPYVSYDPMSILSSGPNTANINQVNNANVTPDVVFAGNCPHYASMQIESSLSAHWDQQNATRLTTLICIPKFSTTLSFVLMNERTKQCIPIYLGTDTADFDSNILGRADQNLGNDDEHAAIEFEDDEEAGEDA